jgi:hypothetical protein
VCFSVIANFGNETFSFTALKLLGAELESEKEAWVKAVEWIAASDGLFVRFLSSQDPEAGLILLFCQL